MIDTPLRRGAIVMVSFDPSVGSEAAKVRPGVVVSNNTANDAAIRAGGVITVVPLTSNTTKVFPFQTLLPAATVGLAHESKAQAEQVRALSVSRVQRIVGWVPAELMGGIDEALRIHLGL